MIKEIHEILKDSECKDNIRCVIRASVVLCLYFGGMCYGFFLLGWSNDLTDDVRTQIREQKEYFEEELAIHHGKIHYGRTKANP